jgi:hypothetical protein
VRTKPQRRKVRLITDVTISTFGKRINGGTPVGYLGYLAVRMAKITSDTLP